MAFGERNRVTYSQEHRQLAKERQLPLITVDIDNGSLPAGHPLGQNRHTFQGTNNSEMIRRGLVYALATFDEMHPQLAEASVSADVKLRQEVREAVVAWRERSAEKSKKPKKAKKV